MIWICVVLYHFCLIKVLLLHPSACILVPLGFFRCTLGVAILGWLTSHGCIMWFGRFPASAQGCAACQGFQLHLVFWDASILSLVNSTYLLWKPHAVGSMLPRIFCISTLWWIDLHDWGAWNSSVMSWGNVSHSQPKYLVLLLRHSKTDMFGTGVSLYMGTTGCNLCPVAVVLSYLAARPSTPGPLFFHQDGRALSHPGLVRAVRTSAGVDTSRYSGHSFRIGAATTAAQAGLQDSLIQTLGRWRSSAFLSYVRTPPSQLLAVSAQLLHWGWMSFLRRCFLSLSCDCSYYEYYYCYYYFFLISIVKSHSVLLLWSKVLVVNLLMGLGVLVLRTIGGWAHRTLPKCSPLLTC